MGLLKIKDYDSDYKNNILGGNDLKGYEFYADTNEEHVGAVRDILVDEDGHLRYLIVDTGFWFFGKKVLLPIGRCRVDYLNNKVIAPNLTREQVENLQEYHDTKNIDRQYERGVRDVYRSSNASTARREKAGVGSTNNFNPANTKAGYVGYNYNEDPDLFNIREADHGKISLYDQRLRADRINQKIQPRNTSGLVKIKEFDSDYVNNILSGYDIKGYSLYAGQDNDKVGSVEDILVDAWGHIRYLVVDTGFWFLGKKVLLPIGSCRIDYNNQKVIATSLTKKQVENLPKYDNNMVVDEEYEENVRNIYRNSTNTSNGSDRDTYNYDQDQDLYGIREGDHGAIKLYEERLIATKNRQKVGEVAVGKTVKTETANTSVPVESERVIVERRKPTNSEDPIEVTESNFQQGEVARVEVYEETAQIDKETFVNEEVTVKKAVDRDTVQAKEELRREEIDVKTTGNPNIRKDRRDR